MMKDKESLINLDIDLNNPIKIGSDIRSLGVPSWDLTFFMLSSYVKTHDVDLRQHLRTVLNLYGKVELSQEHFERTIRVMTDTSIIETIIKEDNPPSYEEAINIINEDVLNQYMVITNKDIDDKESLKQFIALTIEPIAFNLYSIYHTDQYNKYIKQVDFVKNKRMEYINNYKEANSTDERSKLQRELTKWETDKNRDQFMIDYQEKTYKSYDTEKAIDVILAALEQSSNIAGYELDSLDNTIPKQIQNIQSPRSTTVLTDKVTRTLFSGKVPYGEKVPLKMEQGIAANKSDELTTYITLDYESMEDVIPDNINGNDINLTEAIISLVKENEQENIRIFTFNQVYRVLKKNPNTRPNKRGLELLEEKLLKQMRTIFDMNAIDEQRYYKDLEINRRTNFLKAEILTVRYGDSEVKALKVDEMPLIYQYAKAKGQLTTIPFELTDNKLIKTDAVLNLEKYILRSIAQMKNRNHLNRSMRFETIYENMNFTQKTKSAIDNAKSRTIRNTEDILKGLVDCGYIKGFEFKLANKGKYESVKIEL